MDGDIVQALAILVLVLASAASSVFTNYRERQKKSRNIASEADSQPLAPVNQPSKQKSTWVGQTESRQMPNERQYMPNESKKMPGQRTAAPDTASEVAEPPLKKKDVIGDIFRELFEIDIEKPEIVGPSEEELEMMAQEEERRAKQKLRKKKDQLEKSKAAMMRLAQSRIETPAVNPVLAYYAADAAANPLRSSVVLSEIMRKMNKPYIH